MSNNPLAFIDPTGMYGEAAGPDAWEAMQSQNKKEKEGADLYYRLVRSVQNAPMQGAILYAQTYGYEIDKRTVKGQKTAIYTVNTLTKNYDPTNPWANASPLTYAIGAHQQKGGITGLFFRKNHPLFGKGTCAGDRVYREDLLNLTTEFMHLVADALPEFRNIAPNIFAFQAMVTDNGKYDLKSTNTADGTPSYAANVIGEWALLHGTLRRYDDFGNISYGIFGLHAGFSREILLAGSNLNQWWKDFKGITRGSGDEPRDVIMMKLGFSIYHITSH